MKVPAFDYRAKDVNDGGELTSFGVIEVIVESVAAVSSVLNAVFLFMNVNFRRGSGASNWRSTCEKSPQSANH